MERRTSPKAKACAGSAIAGALAMLGYALYVFVTALETGVRVNHFAGSYEFLQTSIPLASLLAIAASCLILYVTWVFHKDHLKKSFKRVRSAMRGAYISVIIFGEFAVIMITVAVIFSDKQATRHPATAAVEAPNTSVPADTRPTPLQSATSEVKSADPEERPASAAGNPTLKTRAAVAPNVCDISEGSTPQDIRACIKALGTKRPMGGRQYIAIPDGDRLRIEPLLPPPPRRPNLPLDITPKLR